MGLVSWLTDVGGKLKIVAPAHVQNSAPEKLKMQSVSLEDLMSTIQAEQVRGVAQLPAELVGGFREGLRGRRRETARAWLDDQEARGTAQDRAVQDA